MRNLHTAPPTLGSLTCLGASAHTIPYFLLYLLYIYIFIYQPLGTSSAPYIWESHLLFKTTVRAFLTVTCKDEAISQYGIVGMSHSWSCELRFFDSKADALKAVLHCLSSEHSSKGTSSANLLLTPSRRACRFFGFPSALVSPHYSVT